HPRFPDLYPHLRRWGSPSLVPSGRPHLLPRLGAAITRSVLPEDSRRASGATRTASHRRPARFRKSILVRRSSSAWQAVSSPRYRDLCHEPRAIAHANSIHANVTASARFRGVRRRAIPRATLLSVRRPSLDAEPGEPRRGQGDLLRPDRADRDGLRLRFLETG